jgi:hypothetical protein
MTSSSYSDAITGDFYYNSTTGQFKTVNDGGAPIGTWASGGNLNAAKQNNAGTGTQTSAISIDSESGTDVELYNGTSWTETTENNTNRRYGGAAGATNTAVLFSGGYTSPPPVSALTELWNGSSWTEVNDLNTARGNVGMSGVTTAALLFGGETTTTVANVESWNGSSWTETTDLNTARTK